MVTYGKETTNSVKDGSASSSNSNNESHSHHILSCNLFNLTKSSLFRIGSPPPLSSDTSTAATTTPSTSSTSSTSSVKPCWINPSSLGIFHTHHHHHHSNHGSEGASGNTGHGSTRSMSFLSNMIPATMSSLVDGTSSMVGNTSFGGLTSSTSSTTISDPNASGPSSSSTTSPFGSFNTYLTDIIQQEQTQIASLFSTSRIEQIMSEYMTAIAVGCAVGAAVATGASVGILAASGFIRFVNHYFVPMLYPQSTSSSQVMDTNDDDDNNRESDAHLQQNGDDVNDNDKSAFLKTNDNPNISILQRSTPGSSLILLFKGTTSSNKVSTTTTTTTMTTNESGHIDDANDSSLYSSPYAKQICVSCLDKISILLCKYGNGTIGWKNVKQVTAYIVDTANEKDDKHGSDEEDKNAMVRCNANDFRTILTNEYPISNELVSSSSRNDNNNNNNISVRYVKRLANSNDILEVEVLAVV